MKYSTLQSPSTSGTAAYASRIKTALVAVLGMLLSWHPSLAIMLGKLVGACWRGFREV